MRWTPGGRSEDVEDRRGMSMGRALPIGGGGLLVLVVLSLLTGKNFLALLGPLSEQTQAPSSEERPVDSSPEENRLVEFVSFVLDDAQATWARLLPGRYRHAKLVLFRDAVQSACGFAEAAT